MTRNRTNDDTMIGKRLRQARLAADFTQSDLATALGVSFQQVQKYETGANRICASKLFRAADILKVDITFFQPGTPGGSIMDDPDALLAAFSVMKLPPKAKQAAVQILDALTHAGHAA